MPKKKKKYTDITKMTFKASKLDQTDLSFGLWSEFISRDHSLIRVVLLQM